MKIKTKYDLGDTVWYMTDNIVQSDVISFIRVEVDESNEPQVIYQTYSKVLPIESYLFSTKKELLDSLFL